MSKKKIIEQLGELYSQYLAEQFEIPGQCSFWSHDKVEKLASKLRLVDESECKHDDFACRDCGVQPGEHHLKYCRYLQDKPKKIEKLEEISDNDRRYLEVSTPDKVKMWDKINELIDDRNKDYETTRHYS